MSPQTPTPPAAQSPTSVPDSKSDMLLPDEHVVTTVHRSLVGLVLIYLEALAGIAALIAVAAFAFPSLFGNLSSESNSWLMAGIIFAVALIFFILFIATYVYRQNRLIVTDKSLVQILQRSLFIRKVSRLSMSNVEDVSANQSGILPTIFDYGTLVVQTAGETDNFIFTYCPIPNIYAERILEARQAYAKSIQEDRQHPATS